MLEPTPGRPSVIVRGGRGEGGRRLLLCGHLDTVGHAGLPEPLVPRIEGDRLYDRGGYDIKDRFLAHLQSPARRAADLYYSSYRRFTRPRAPKRCSLSKVDGRSQRC